MPKEYAPGDAIGPNLLLVARLGSGGMGTVWRARHRHLRTDVAVKQLVIPGDVAEPERAERLERARREGRTAARLPPHPNIVGVRDLIEEDGVPWLVMNLVEGRSLAEVVREDGPLSPWRAAAVGLQMAGALQVMHRQGVLHRDIKPDNILLTDDGDAVLVDFGIAVHADDETLTAQGMLVGTPAYLDPERLRDDPAVPASDLFCLGATLYFAVEGRAPFQRGTRDATYNAILSARPARYRRAGAFGAVLDGLFAADPGSRTGVDELIRRLSGFLDDGEPPPQPPPPQRTESTATAPAPRRPPRPRPSPARRTPTELNDPSPKAAAGTPATRGAGSLGVSAMDFEWVGHALGLVALAVALIAPPVTAAGVGRQSGHPSQIRWIPLAVLAVVYFACHYGAMFYSAHLFDTEVGCGYFIAFELMTSALALAGILLHAHLGFVGDAGASLVHVVTRGP